MLDEAYEVPFGEAVIRQVGTAVTLVTWAPAPPVLCPRCESALVPVPQIVRTAIWQHDRVAIVEDIPAHVCNSCMEQFYDDDVSDALRKLTEDGFPAAEAEKEIPVPVFSLKTRIRKRQAMPEDSYVD